MTNKQTIYKKVEDCPYLNELRLLGNDNPSLEECYLYGRLKANDTRTDKLINSEKNTARKRNSKKVEKNEDFDGEDVYTINGYISSSSIL